MVSQPRWLIVLERSRWDLYWDLRRRFAGRAHVCFDRRKGDQRGAMLAVERDRRDGRERREPLTLPEQRMWQDFGYRLVFKLDGVDIHEYPVGGLPPP
jgi:hypothetical protein